MRSLIAVPVLLAGTTLAQETGSALLSSVISQLSLANQVFPTHTGDAYSNILSSAQSGYSDLTSAYLANPSLSSQYASLVSDYASQLTSFGGTIPASATASATASAGSATASATASLNPTTTATETGAISSALSSLSSAASEASSSIESVASSVSSSASSAASAATSSAGADALIGSGLGAIGAGFLGLAALL